MPIRLPESKRRKLKRLFDVLNQSLSAPTSREIHPEKRLILERFAKAGSPEDCGHESGGGLFSRGNTCSRGSSGNPHDTEETWKNPNPNWKKRAYGGVVSNKDGNILLREPSNHFDGYVWTFPKGKLNHEHENPAEAALREVEEETGYKCRITGLVKGKHKGGTGETYFYKMEPVSFDKSKMDWETASTQWVSPKDAINYINKTENEIGRARDAGVLKSYLEKDRYAKAGDPDDCGHEMAGKHKAGKFTKGNTCATGSAASGLSTYEKAYSNIQKKKGATTGLTYKQQETIMNDFLDKGSDEDLDSFIKRKYNKMIKSQNTAKEEQVQAPPEESVAQEEQGIEEDIKELLPIEADKQEEAEETKEEESAEEEEPEKELEEVTEEEIQAGMKTMLESIKLDRDLSWGMKPSVYDAINFRYDADVSSFSDTTLKDYLEQELGEQDEKSPFEPAGEQDKENETLEKIYENIKNGKAFSSSTDISSFNKVYNEFLNSQDLASLEDEKSYDNAFKKFINEKLNKEEPKEENSESDWLDTGEDITDPETAILKILDNMENGQVWTTGIDQNTFDEIYGEYETKVGSNYVSGEDFKKFLQGEIDGEDILRKEALEKILSNINSSDIQYKGVNYSIWESLFQDYASKNEFITEQGFKKYIEDELKKSGSPPEEHKQYANKYDASNAAWEKAGEILGHEVDVENSPSSDIQVYIDELNKVLETQKGAVAKDLKDFINGTIADYLKAAKANEYKEIPPDTKVKVLHEGNEYYATGNSNYFNFPNGENPYGEYKGKQAVIPEVYTTNSAMYHSQDALKKDLLVPLSKLEKIGEYLKSKGLLKPPSNTPETAYTDAMQYLKDLYEKQSIFKNEESVEFNSTPDWKEEEEEEEREREESSYAEDDTDDEEEENEDEDVSESSYQSPGSHYGDKSIKPAKIKGNYIKPFQVYDSSSDVKKFHNEIGEKNIKHFDHNEIQSIYKYTGSQYKNMNEYLRQGIDAGHQNKRWVEDLTKALDKSTIGKNLVLYRGLSSFYKVAGKELPHDPSELIGDIYVDKGFMSSSLEFGTAESFASLSNGAIYEIYADKNTKGTSSDGQAASGQEYEFVLQRNHAIKIEGFYYKNGYLVLQGRLYSGKEEALKARQQESEAGEVHSRTGSEVRGEVRLGRGGRGVHSSQESQQSEFPKRINSLEYVGPAGGTTGAKIMKDKHGSKFIQKKGKSPEHLKEEMAADNIYRSAGINVPEFSQYDVDGKPVKLSKFIDAKPLSHYIGTPKQNEIYKKISDGFIMDALMGNWDVIGEDLDNIMVDKNDNVYRIDNGGSLRYRAQGKLKTNPPFGAAVGELKTLRDADRNPNAATVFSDLTNEDIKKQIKELDKNWEKIKRAIPDDLKEIMQKRKDYIDDYGYEIKDQYSINSNKKKIIERFALMDNKKDQQRFFAAVAVVRYSGKEPRYLLGLAKTDDDRDGKWCFPGGGIKPSENHFDAAARECREETKAYCRASRYYVTIKSKPGIAFVLCYADHKSMLKPNHEFSNLGWFTLDEIENLDVYKNQISIIRRLEDMASNRVARYARAGDSNDCGHEIHGGEFSKGNTCAGDNSEKKSYNKKDSYIYGDKIIFTKGMYKGLKGTVQGRHKIETKGYEARNPESTPYKVKIDNPGIAYKNIVTSHKDDFAIDEDATREESEKWQREFEKAQQELKKNQESKDSKIRKDIISKIKSYKKPPRISEVVTSIEGWTPDQLKPIVKDMQARKEISITRDPKTGDMVMKSNIDRYSKSKECSSCKKSWANPDTKLKIQTIRSRLNAAEPEILKEFQKLFKEELERGNNYGEPKENNTFA